MNGPAQYSKGGCLITCYIYPYSSAYRTSFPCTYQQLLAVQKETLQTSDFSITFLEIIAFFVCWFFYVIFSAIILEWNKKGGRWCRCAFHWIWVTWYIGWFQSSEVKGWYHTAHPLTSKYYVLYRMRLLMANRCNWADYYYYYYIYLFFFLAHDITTQFDITHSRLCFSLLEFFRVEIIGWLIYIIKGICINKIGEMRWENTWGYRSRFAHPPLTLVCRLNRLPKEFFCFFSGLSFWFSAL